jgi:hypothetical protein
MTTPTTPREPLDLEALERDLDAITNPEGYGQLRDCRSRLLDAVPYMLARIRELEAALAKRTETSQ